MVVLIGSELCRQIIRHQPKCLVLFEQSEFALYAIERELQQINSVFSGLRPGEKLFEELLIGDDAQGTAHPRIMMAREVCMTWPEVAGTVKQLQHASQAFDCEGVLTILKTAPTGFAPNGGCWGFGVEFESAACGSPGDR